MPGVLRKQKPRPRQEKGMEDSETHGGHYNDTETGVTWASEHPGLLAPPEAREQNGTGSPVSGRNQPTDTLTLDFWPSEP